MKNIQNYMLNVSFLFCCVQIVDILFVFKRALRIKNHTNLNMGNMEAAN